MGSRGTALINMELAALVLVLVAAASGQRHQVDEVLKSEIEQAASESRHLADELAGMLDRLEIEEDRSAAVNAAVLGEQEEVEAALKVMVEKIENLAQASEDSSSETVSGLVKKKRVKEQELRKTLEQLELVASQIEEAADTADSIEEVDTIEKIAKLLQSISNKVEANNEDESIKFHITYFLKYDLLNLVAILLVHIIARLLRLVGADQPLLGIAQSH